MCWIFPYGTNCKVNLPFLVEVSPPPLMICDGADPTKLAQRMKMASLFGGSKLKEFDNPYCGLTQIQFDSFMDNLYGPIPSLTEGTMLSNSPAGLRGVSCACPEFSRVSCGQSTDPSEQLLLNMFHESFGTEHDFNSHSLHAQAPASLRQHQNVSHI